MRKWVRIPAVLLLVVVAVVLPRNEMEVHKKKCQAAWQRVTGKSLTARMRDYYDRKVTGMNRKKDDLEEWHSTQEVLIELGYLARERFVLRNGPTRAEEAFYKERPPDGFVRVEEYQNIFEVIAPRSEMAAISNIVARIDERAR